MLAKVLKGVCAMIFPKNHVKDFAHFTPPRFALLPRFGCCYANTLAWVTAPQHVKGFIECPNNEVEQVTPDEV